MTEKVHKQPVKELKIHSCFFARHAWRDMSACLKKRMTNCKGLHTINAVNVGSTRDLISQNENV